MHTRRFIFFALAATGEGMSGGDRIFIEFAKRWSENMELEIYTSQSGKRMCQILNLPKKILVHSLNFNSLEYFSKILTGIYLGLKLSLTEDDVIYSASEFWMDSLPAFVLKLRFPKVKWVAAWYQTAPNPISGFSDGRYRFSALLYWLAQLPIKPLVSNFADLILINNDSEKKYFVNSQQKLIVVLGAVDTESISKYITDHPKTVKIYDAVFQGRFHPQKGVVELIKIWRLVVDKLPNAKLCMIGDGPLMGEVKQQVDNLALTKNVDLVGYVFDGMQKYRIFAQSKMVVHPAFFDSGGMASAEAMAFGLPVLGFDLEAYKSYYPQGMLKSPVGDLQLFADNIVKLLNNSVLRDKIGKQAARAISEDWSWNKRAQEILTKIDI